MIVEKGLPAGDVQPGDEHTNQRTYQFKALTDVWTGDADRSSDRLITTGLLGSIRWWFEVLVRGLGGSACDPTHTESKYRCPDERNEPGDAEHHCVVCELFGCACWARKFRFAVLDKYGDIKTDQIIQNQTFSLRFTPFRPIRIEEWTLIEAVLRLIPEYGAIGGKTIFKPTDETSRASKLHHKDYGLVHRIMSQQFDGVSRGDLETYLSKWRKLDHGGFAWASLQNFWCVNGMYLRRQDDNRSTFNQVLGRQEAKNRGQLPANRNDEIARWLAGSQQKSKKVFSFRKPARTFGFVKPGLVNFNTMKQRLADAWGRNGWVFLTGDKIISQLFAGKENCL